MSLLGSPNSIILKVPQKDYTPGSVISGNVELVFPDGLKINGISVDLITKTKTTRGEQISHTQPLTILGAGVYNSKSLNFEYRIPEGVLPKKFHGFGKIGNIPEWAVRIINIAMNMLGKPTDKTIEFLIEAKVDIPWGSDICERVFVSIAHTGLVDIDIPTENGELMETPPKKEDTNSESHPVTENK